MPYPNEHALRLRDPGDFDPDTFRRTSGSGNGRVQGVVIPDTIDVIWGKLRGKADADDPVLAQALRFPIENWTEKQARDWIDENGLRGTFEPAAPQKQSARESSMKSGEWMISDTHFSAAGGVNADQGIIRDVAICTEGEAKGHGVFLDADFVGKVVEDGNATRSGVKARFGHPTMSSTALGSFVGRFKNFRVDASGGSAVARADLFLSNACKDTPQGNLFDYVLKLASEDAQAFGTSIVFKRGDTFILDDDGEKIKTDDMARPVADGERVFVECSKFLFCDLVDDPAANPGGLFSAWAAETWAGQVSEFLDTHPEIFELLERNPEAIEGFMARYKAYLERKGSTMDADLTAAEIASEEVAEDGAADVEAVEATEEASEAEGSETEEGDAEGDDSDGGEGAEADAGETGELEAAAEEAGTPQPATEGQAFLDAFGDIGGVWFAKGFSMEEAKDQYIAHLKAENDRLKAQAEIGGEDPISFGEPTEDRPKPDFLAAATAKATADGTSLSVAMAALATEDPALFSEYKSAGNSSK